MRVRAIFYIIVSISSWSWRAQCVADQAIDSTFPLSDTDATQDSLSGSENLFDLNGYPDPTDLIASEFMNPDGDIALTPGGDHSSCAQPLGKRDENLFEDDLLLSNA